MKIRSYVIVLILLMLIGIFLCHLYLNLIRIFDAEIMPMWSMWIGVAISSVSVTILYFACERFRRLTPFLLAALFLLSLSFLMMPSSRYNFAVGPASGDTLKEYAIAQETFVAKKWPLELIGVNEYASALSVTVLPTVIAEVSGLPIEAVFGFIFPLIGALVPIFLFIATRAIFHDHRIASLSALLYGINYWYIFYAADIKKELVAIVLLLMALWSIFQRRSARYCFLALFSIFGVVFSHYTVADLTIIVFSMSLIAPWGIRKIARALKISGIARKRITPIFTRFRAPSVIPTALLLLYLIVAALAWLFFIAYPLFLVHVNLGQRMIMNVIGLQHEELNASIRSVAGATGGPIVTVWFDLQFILIVIGTLYVLLRFVGDHRKAFCAYASLGVVTILGASLFIPTLTKALAPERWVDFGYIFFAPCMSVFFLGVKTSGRRVHLKYVLCIFLLLSPTMNLLLPSEWTKTFLLYHPESEVPSVEVGLQTPVHSWDISFSEWISKYVSSTEYISMDRIGTIPAILANHNKTLENYPAFDENGFLIMHRYYIDFGVWLRMGEAYERVPTATKNVSINQMYSEASIPYDNGYYELLARVPP